MFPTTGIDANTNPGDPLRPPQATEACGTITAAPVGTANPDVPTFYDRVSKTLVNVEKMLIGTPPALGSPANSASIVGSLSAIQRINRHFVFGDSLGARTAPILGFIRISNGPTYPELLSTGLGINPEGRYIIEGAYNGSAGYYVGDVVIYGGQSWICTQLSVGNTPSIGSAFWQLWNPEIPGAAPGSIISYSNAYGWDNYAISGGTWNGANAVLTQVNLFKTDFNIPASNVPANALFFFQFTGINDTAQLIANHGGGMVTAVDPLPISIPSFTQPAVGSDTAAIAFPSIPTGVVVGTQIWVTGGGVYNVKTITGLNVVLTLQAAFFLTNPIAATGATVPGGAIRWAAAQAIDDIFTSYVATVNSLITAGATNIIISNCPNYSITPFGQTAPLNPTNVGNTITQWNTKLTAAFASLIASNNVALFDLAGQYAAIIANPPKYNLYDLDGGIGVGSNPNQADNLWLYDALIHFSAATHRIHAAQLASLVISFYPPSPQLLALASIFNIEPNSNIIPWTSANGVYNIAQTPTPLPLPAAASSNDPRLLLAQTIQQPTLSQWAGTDYDKGVILPDATWTAWTNGGGSATLTFGDINNGFGVLGQTLTAVNDGYGQIKSANPIIVANTNRGYGPLTFVLRIGRIANSGDQITWRGGLVDALILARPLNGIFLEIIDNNGTFSCNLILAAGGAFTLLPVPFTSYISNSNCQTFMFVCDRALRWFGIYTSPAFPGGGILSVPVLCAFGKLPVLSVGATLCLAWQVIKVALTSAVPTYCLCDGVWVLNNNNVRA